MMAKPDDVFDRDQEWKDLQTFTSAGGERPGVGIVYGRRRQGKSYLLRRLSRSYGGLYFMAVEEDRALALERFGRALGKAAGIDAPVQLNDWEQALSLGLTAPGSDGRGRLLILDELPYLLRHSPEIPSLVQALVDDGRHTATAGAKLILCGSSLSVMSELLSGMKPVRGRAWLNQRITPFDYRTAAEFWSVRECATALALDAIVGGTPGYRDLIQIGAPESSEELFEWLAATVLNPSHALFEEASFLLQEDPRVRDRAVYHSILRSVADGQTTPRAIGGRIGRDERALAHPLATLVTGGFLYNEDDILRQRRPTYQITDPLVRFLEHVVSPRRVAFEERRTRAAWESASSTLSAQILGPHFEHLCRIWVRKFSSSDTWEVPPGEVGRATLDDPQGKSQLELDVVALADGQRRQPRRPDIAVIGEAKHCRSPRTPADVERLDHARGLLEARGARTTDARLAIFGASGFDDNLVALARRRSDVVLVDLERLYHGH
jgi:uncharacterized protein